MKISYDKKVDALYIRFQNRGEKVSRTIKLKDFLLVDMAAKGQVYGIEILQASSHVPEKGLQRIARHPMTALL